MVIFHLSGDHYPVRGINTKKQGCVLRTGDAHMNHGKTALRIIETIFIEVVPHDRIIDKNDRLALNGLHIGVVLEFDTGLAAGMVG